MWRVTPVFVLGFLLTGSMGCGKKAAGGKTPEDAFNQAIELVKKEKFNEAVGYLTADSQKAVTGGLVVAGVMANEFAKFSGADTKEVEAVLKKHSVSADKVKEKFGEVAKAGKDDAKAQIDALKSMAAEVTDGPAFVQDMVMAMKKMDKEQKDISEELKDASIKDVKVDGDKATGNATIKGKSKELHFVRESGAWRIDITPFIMEKAK